MEIKEKWTDDDFDEMGWHDSKLYQLKFLDENYHFTLYLDYIFEWVKEKEGYKFWVSPCVLTFENVVNLNLNLSFENNIGVYIVAIDREKIGFTPNGKMMEWKYLIETDRGNIEFASTGFKMERISEPVLTESQDLSS